MEYVTIRKILDSVQRGQVRIPAFQRGFVWEPERVAFLMDSIYKNYPFGALLYWRTFERLKIERKLGPFTLPDPEADHPVDYVLDGQQRITSIFGVFQTALAPTEDIGWMDIYFDFRMGPNAQDTQFFALRPDEVDPDRHFPLKTLFDSVDYRRATQPFNNEVALLIDDMQAVFKEVQIPVQVFRTDDKATVAIIFERVNRQGIPLDTLQLLAAWTWSEEFELHEQFRDLAEELQPFGFGDLQMDLLLRCCSAILVNDASPKALVDLHGETVRRRFEEVLNGIRGAIDYLQTNLHVHSIDNLPFPTIIVPLSVFFAVTGNEEAAYDDEQRTILNKWFWRSCFSRRYSSGVLRNLKTDIEEMVKLRQHEPSKLGAFSCKVTSDYFAHNRFGMGSVNTKTFILMLAQASPRSFISGAPIDLRETLRLCNRNEFHHLNPRAFLEEQEESVYSESCLANFCFLSRADNRRLGGKAPSLYRAQMPADIASILQTAICPESLFNDDFEEFIDERASMLTDVAESLCERGSP